MAQFNHLSRLLGIAPPETEECTQQEAQDAVEEFFRKMKDGGGENLRKELRTSLTGGRLVLVFDWEDM